ARLVRGARLRGNRDPLGRRRARCRETARRAGACCCREGLRRTTVPIGSPDQRLSFCSAVATAQESVIAADREEPVTRVRPGPARARDRAIRARNLACSPPPPPVDRAR